MIDKEKVLIISNHHRLIPFFTRSIERLYEGGYRRFLIQDTGGDSWTKFRCKYPSIKTTDFGTVTNYFEGMKRYKRELITQDSFPDIEYIVLVDNDLFLTNVEVLNKYLELFIKGNYDNACYYQHPIFYEMNEHHFEDNLLALVPMQKIFNYSPNLDIIAYSAVSPDIYPWPNWENAFQLIRRSMWNNLSVEDVSHGRKWIKALVRENAKLGTLKVNYLTDPKYISFPTRPTTHYGDNWFHFGDFMYYLYAIERNKTEEEWTRLDNSVYTRARIGCVVEMVNKYGNTFSPEFGENLIPFANRYGGAVKCVEEWNKMSKGTCMEYWQD